MEINGDKASAVIGKILNMLGAGTTAPASECGLPRGAPRPKEPKIRKSRIARKNAFPFAPMPLTPRMVVLRDLAEDLHRRWTIGDRAFAEEKLNMASRVDLGIVCGLLVDCAQPSDRHSLASWLEFSLSQERFNIVPYGVNRGQLEAEEFFSPPARSDAMPLRASSARKAFAVRGVAESMRISTRLITLGEAASQLQIDWLEGDRGVVRDCLDQSSRIDLGILCSLLNERMHPLRRPEFMNWLEANLDDNPPISGDARCKWRTR